MPFLTGNVTYMRFRVDRVYPPAFGEEHLAQLRERAAGRSRLAAADGVECGWTASGHVLDTDFTLLKNVVNDALLFDLRVDTDKLPADLLRAYYETDLAALAAGNPSGFASAKQKREARESARDRLEDEAKDGRFKKRKCIPVMWDAKRNEVLFGSASSQHLDRFQVLFRETFDGELTPFTAHRGSGELSLSPFVPGVTPDAPAWSMEVGDRHFLGNEFLLWLWFNADGESDTIALQDKSDATYMIARTLVVDCPRGQSGTDGFRHGGPSKLPEALRAIRAGKLPRKCGLTLVRQDEQYELTLQAETLAVSGARLPKPDADLDREARRQDRIDRVRHLVETVEQLYQAFLSIRLQAGWPEQLARIQKWLAQPERRAAA